MSRFFVSVCFYVCSYFLLTETNEATSVSKTEIVIEPNIAELEVNAGEKFKLKCKGNVPLSWTNISRENASTVTDLFENGIHTSTLQLYQAYFLDTGFFYCFPRGNSLNSPHAAKIYVYVKDEDNLLAVNELFDSKSCYQYGTLLLPCRPTARDVIVKLTVNDKTVIPNDPASDMKVTYDQQRGYSLNCSRTSFSGDYMCTGSRGDKTSEAIYSVNVIKWMLPEKPNISVTPSHIYVGDKVNMICSYQIVTGDMSSIYLSWTLPTDKHRKSEHIEIKDDESESSIGSRELVIYNVTKEHIGTYHCHVNHVSGNRNSSSKYLKIYDRHMNFLNLSIDGNKSVFEVQAGDEVEWTVNIDANPVPHQVIWYDPHKKKIIGDNKRYKIMTDNEISKMRIEAPDISDYGLYTLFVRNTVFNRTINITLFVQDKPKVISVVGKSQGFYMVNEMHKIECNVIAYPKPKIEWYFKNHRHGIYTSIPTSTYSNRTLNEVSMTSIIDFLADTTGELLCSACNKLGCDNYTAPFVVTDVENGFSASAPKQVVTTDNITLHCGASKNNYTPNPSWYYRHNKSKPKLITNSSGHADWMVTYVKKPYSYNVLLQIPKVNLWHTGEYICKTTDFRKRSVEERRVFVDVQQLKGPVFLKNSNMNKTLDRVISDNVTWNCFVNGTPTPMIVWRKDNKLLNLTNRRYSLSDNNQTLEIEFLAPDDNGVYTCTATNKGGSIKATGTVKLTNKSRNIMIFMIGVVIVCLILLVVVTGLYIRKLIRTRKLKQVLTAAGLLDFEKGCIESLNPALDVIQQAEFLPYDKRWEFPREKLKLGKQLGSGAFGVVLEAEAYGLKHPGVPSVVAVKMVKKNCDIIYIKALISELKIMIHLGKHLNVVNVLGACTGNLKYGELLVMVEYCRYGNMHNYLLEHRDAYINQVNTKTGQFDSTFLDTFIRLNYANLSFNGGVQQECRNNRKSQTDATHVTSGMTSVSTPLSEDGYLIYKEPEPEPEPEWGTYKFDFKGKSVRPISTQDLLCWGFQVARGMEYLASRKVLHGDLAARNVLLAVENVVKICDFGFSKSMYKDNSYHKTSSGPLPVKWMSIEAIRDKVFSTQSDVWAYGILLWEFFTLAQTPYPGMEADEKLFNKLVEGYRMERPKYATNEVYTVMLECWHQKPQMRPSFTDVAERMGNMLEDTVRMHYVNMNDPFLKSNTEFLTQQDYLSMLRSPTYSNWQPSPFNEYTSMTSGSASAEGATEQTPIPNSVSEAVSPDMESATNSPTSNPNNPIDNDFVNAAQTVGFSNPHYQIFGQPMKNSYVNVPGSADES